MQVQEFLDRFNPGRVPPVVLLCPGTAGKSKNVTFEPVRAQQAADRIVEAFIDPSLRDLAYALYYGDEADPAGVVLEAQTLPFLADRRVVEVRNADVYETETRGKAIHAYLASPNETTVLILVASRIDRRLKFFKACQKAGEIIECPELSEREVHAWVGERMDTLGKRIDGDAVSELVRRAGTRLGDVNNAIQVVADYVGGKGRVTQEDVAGACADVAEEEIWALTDAIAASEVGKAVTALRKLLAFGKAPDEIMGTINWLVKMTYGVLVPESGQKVHAFVADKVRKLGDKFGRAKTQDAFKLCTSTHFMMRSTGVDPELALELLVIKLAAPRKAPQPKRGAVFRGQC
ncbi:MAG TPA: DNA polymerase III subunit delta [Candidatus Hydrogenedentes bacterium]|nr:DNA polymerase III subunit delta [Candidatus Hydrogenedentota bacterium]